MVSVAELIVTYRNQSIVHPKNCKAFYGDRETWRRGNRSHEITLCYAFSRHLIDSNRPAEHHQTARQTSEDRVLAHLRHMFDELTSINKEHYSAAEWRFNQNNIDQQKLWFMEPAVYPNFKDRRHHKPEVKDKTVKCSFSAIFKSLANPFLFEDYFTKNRTISQKQQMVSEFWDRGCDPRLLDRLDIARSPRRDDKSRFMATSRPNEDAFVDPRTRAPLPSPPPDTGPDNRVPRISGDDRVPRISGDDRVPRISGDARWSLSKEEYYRDPETTHLKILCLVFIRSDETTPYISFVMCYEDFARTPIPIFQLRWNNKDYRFDYPPEGDLYT